MICTLVQYMLRTVVIDVLLSSNLAPSCTKPISVSAYSSQIIRRCPTIEVMCC
jgi:hypothetical protein